MKVRVAPSAIADLDEIWAYAAENASIETAERLVDSIVHRFALLARNPEAGRSRDDIRHGLRSFPVGNYRIYYRNERTCVRVLFVRHAARSESKLFD